MRGLARRAGALAAIGLAALAAACGGKGEYTAPVEPPYEIHIEPAMAVAAEGRLARFEAIVNRPVGQASSNYWSVPGGCAGVINHTPGITADVHAWSGPCTTEVRVVNWSYDPDSIARARLIVLPVSPKSLELLPAALTVEVGNNGSLVPTVRDSVGVTLVRTAITWEVANPLVATIAWVPGGGFSGSGTAVVEGVAPGRTLVTAHLGGLSAQAWVDVVAAASTLP